MTTNSVNTWNTGEPAVDDDGFGPDGKFVAQGSNFDGGFVSLPGLYLFMIGEWQWKADKRLHEFELSVVSSFDGQSPVGSKLNHAIWLKDKDGNPAQDLSQTANFFVGLGLMTKEKRDGKTVVVNLVANEIDLFDKHLFNAAKGRLCWGEVQMRAPKNSTTGKQFASLSFGNTYPVDDARFSDKPADPMLMDVAGFERVNGRWQKKGVGGKPAAAPTNAAPATQQSAPASRIDPKRDL